MPLTPVPLTLQTIYADLTQQVYAAPLRPGSVYRRAIKGIEYLYAKIPVGEGRIDLFLGRVDDEAAATKALAMKRRRNAPPSGGGPFGCFVRVDCRDQARSLDVSWTRSLMPEYSPEAAFSSGPPHTKAMHRSSDTACPRPRR